jgi:hypothetical protein
VGASVKVRLFGPMSGPVLVNEGPSSFPPAPEGRKAAPFTVRITFGATPRSQTGAVDFCQKPSQDQAADRATIKVERG